MYFDTILPLPLCLCSVEHKAMAMGRSYVSNWVGRLCSPNPDFCMPFLAERDTKHNYYVQMKFTALSGASDSSITFKSCLAAVGDPVHDNSAGWVQARSKCDLWFSSLTKQNKREKEKTKQKYPITPPQNCHWIHFIVPKVTKFCHFFSKILSIALSIEYILTQADFHRLLCLPWKRSWQ